MLEPLQHLKLIRENARSGGAPRKGDLKRIRALRFSLPGFDIATWRQMCASGWPGQRLAREAGGAALPMKAFCALAEELGANLVPEPLLTAAMAAALLPADLLADVLSGTRIVLPAWQETPHGLALTGSLEYREGRLDGRKLLVPMAAGADAFLVTVPGGLALVERGAPGLHIDVQPTDDGGHFGTLVFDRAPAAPIAGDASDALEQTIMAHAAYLLGLMERAFAITQEHLAEQERSGRIGGSAQAQQHRVADLQVQLDLTRTVVKNAAIAIDAEKRPAARQALVSRAKLRAADAAMTVTRGCVQLYGGLAHTDVVDLNLYLRKATVLAPLYGAPSVHRARSLAALAPDPSPAPSPIPSPSGA